MAKLKMLRLPKKPKANASVAVKEAYLKKVSETKHENQRRHAENQKSARLDKQIRSINANSVKPSAHSAGSFGKKRRSAKPARKKAAKRRKK